MNLVEGNTYTFYIEKGPSTIVKKKVKLLKCYKHHAMFELNNGIRQCFRYFDIARYLQPGGKPCDE